ncbi:hypothetical protein HB816_09345 [Listeria booriae]|uniref:hypothetical protein n=1 Tax=Listeria booriae TaxID=1552123 RepID=UPI0016289960|nr:hypothetical protein [Listeria booriae]MBC1230649.1 hypothetical protein [Listeria booriae]
MTRNNTTLPVSPSLERITVTNEAEIMEKLRESELDKQQGRVMSSSDGWAMLGMPAVKRV